MTRLVAVFLLLAIAPCWAYPNFQQNIPNGNQVPNPCKADGEPEIWEGVGHIIAAGGTKQLNPFGKAFRLNGFKWDKVFCQLDSDEDGISNGAELGDPDCTWVKGETPSGTATSHPGIHNTSPPDWYKCEAKTECPGFSEPGIKTYDHIIGTNEKVPPIMTSYKCRIHELPKGGPYHIVGYSPIIDNKKVLHHLVGYACQPGTEKDFTDLEKNSMFDCGLTESMGGASCNHFMTAWGFGSGDTCFPSNMGLKFGGTDSFLGGGPITHVMINAHWTNPFNETGLTDSSGLRLYYTETLRPKDAGLMMVGPVAFGIPPRKKSFKVYGDCDGSCTKQYGVEEYDVVFTAPHMHQLGRRQKLEQWRDGVRVATYFDVDYDYNLPGLIEHNPPIKLKPGDKLVTVCEFDSTDMDKVVTFGEGTFEEMCFGFLTMTPPVPLTRCINLNDDVYKNITRDMEGVEQELTWAQYNEQLKQGMMQQNYNQGYCGIGGALPKEMERDAAVQPLLAALKTIGIDPAKINIAEMMQRDEVKLIAKMLFGDCDMEKFATMEMPGLVADAMIDCPHMARAATSDFGQTVPDKVSGPKCDQRCNNTLGKIEMHSCMKGVGGTLLRGGLAMMNTHMSHVLEAGEMNCGFKAKSTIGDIADMLPDRTGGGDPVLKCGTGTEKKGNECVSVQKAPTNVESAITTPKVKCGSGTKLEGNECVASPASKLTASGAALLLAALAFV